MLEVVSDLGSERHLGQRLLFLWSVVYSRQQYLQSCHLLFQIYHKLVIYFRKNFFKLYYILNNKTKLFTWQICILVVLKLWQCHAFRAQLLPNLEKTRCHWKFPWPVSFHFPHSLFRKFEVVHQYNCLLFVKSCINKKWLVYSSGTNE